MSSARFSLIVVSVFGLFVLASVLPRIIAYIRVGLGLRRESQEADRERRPPANAVSAYHDALKAENAAQFETVDPRTWNDLDLDDVFGQADKTMSRVGQQYFYHRLRSPQYRIEPLEQLHQAAAAFQRRPESAQAVRRALSSLDDTRAGFLVDLLYAELPNRPRYWWMFPLLTVTSVTLLAASTVWPIALVGVLAVSVLNVITQLYYRPRVQSIIPAIHEIPAFLQAARTLGARREGTDNVQAIEKQRETLRSGSESLSVLRRTTAWLKFEPAQEASEALTTLYTYANLLLLLDVNAFVFALNAARVARPQLRQMFDALGFIDCAQSVAQWRNSLPIWSTPEFTPATKALAVDGLVHPLVSNAVPNALTVDQSSVLITGSNMSGKTTFVRALGLNAILAQTLFTTSARHWRAPLLQVGTSIARNDSVLEGKSYYLAEVESVLTLIRNKDNGHQHLFLLDELYRGTNTAERVAAGYAVLQHLDAGNDIVVVATHDADLLDMLGSSYMPQHFREQIENGVLSFDFTMRSGRATTRNAIALLELMGYPPEVVTVAYTAVGGQQQSL